MADVPLYKWEDLVAMTKDRPIRLLPSSPHMPFDAHFIKQRLPKTVVQAADTLVLCPMCHDAEVKGEKVTLTILKSRTNAIKLMSRRCHIPKRWDRRGTYHKRIQKKWDKRFGMCAEGAPYVLEFDRNSYTFKDWK